MLGWEHVQSRRTPPTWEQLWNVRYSSTLAAPVSCRYRRHQVGFKATGLLSSPSSSWFVTQKA